jgi:hypothetical protein
MWTKEYRPPTLPDLVQHLERFGGQRAFNNDIFSQYLPGVLKRMQEYEGIGTMVVYTDWLGIDNLRKVKVPLNTSAGIRWRKHQLPKKKDALSLAAQEAAADIRGLVQGIEYDTPPCFVAGRGKLVDAGKERGKKEGRLIVVPDLKRHLLGSIASVPYSTLVKGLSKGNGGVMIGMGPFNGEYAALWEQIHALRPMYFLCVDFSGYDQTVPAEVIRASLTRISRRFDRPPGAIEYWDSEYEHLVNTKIVLPNGQVYVKRRGVASGDPWTSQVGSDANWIMEEIVFDYLGWDARAWTFGDDVIIAILSGPVDQELAMSMYTRAMNKIFGLEVKPSDSYVTNHLLINGPTPVEEASVKFLSNYFMWRDGYVRPVPTFDSVVERMMYPEKNDFDLLVYPTEGEIAENFAYEKARIRSMLCIAWFNVMANDMLHRYYDWLDALDPGGGVVSWERWTDLFIKWDLDPRQAGPWMYGLPTHLDIVNMYAPEPYPPLIVWLLRLREWGLTHANVDAGLSLAGQTGRPPGEVVDTFLG